jgi:hypothetical protein
MNAKPVAEDGSHRESSRVRLGWAVLVAGGCLAIGTTVGIATGAIVFGPSNTEVAAAGAPTDQRLAWLHELCDDATPIETLIEYRVALMQYLPAYREDPVLWRGIERLGSAVIDDRDLPERQRIAIELLAFLNRAPPAVGFDKQLLVPELRMISRGR